MFPGPLECRGCGPAVCYDAAMTNDAPHMSARDAEGAPDTAAPEAAPKSVTPPDVVSASVIMAMSGGVDSSVAALLLAEEGYAVTGATMKLFGNEALPEGTESTCCSLDDVEDAKAVCRRLGVPHYTFNFGDLFGQQVMNRFCNAYLCGSTPNPCIDCNRYLKFDALQRRRAELGLDYVATGHYARRRFDEATGRWQLLRGVDPAKDQSYVLYHLTQDALAHMLFPLGELTKSQVRKLARENGFVNAEKPESQDICFVPDGDYVAFIERRVAGRNAGGIDGAPSDWFCSGSNCAENAPSSSFSSDAAAAFQPGPIVDREGRLIGQHRGLIHYTIGQRKGIGVAAPEPLYVYAKNTAENQLVVGTASEVLVRGVKARDVNLIATAELPEPTPVQVKTHYRQTPVEAVAQQTGPDELSITFAASQRAAAPGQAVVLYQDDLVVGGGTIAAYF